MSDRKTIEMDTPDGRVSVPAAAHRLRGADRSGLGEKGWSEVAEDRIGRPDDTNVAEEFFETPSEAANDRNL
jgi:hypothetical protein